MSPLEKKQRKLSGLMWMMVGSAIVFMSVVMMNELSETPQPEELVAASQINVKASPPKPPERKPAPKPKPKKAKHTSAPKPKLGNLGSNIAGVDLGGPAFAADDFDGDDDGLLGDTGNAVMTADTLDVLPKASRTKAFAYPASARKKGVTGYVTVSMLISAEGRIERIEILESSPPGVFDDIVTAGMRSWKFTPGQYQGHAVKSWAEQTIRFNLN